MDITPRDNVSRDSSRMDDELPRLGEWYWVKGKNPDSEAWLGCVMKIGSNFAELHSPHGRNAHNAVRIHVDDFDTRLTAEPNAEAIIARNIETHRQAANALMREVNELQRALGLRDVVAISASGAADNESRALATLSSQVDVKSYEQALMHAKTETLPGLFKRIEFENLEMSRWLQATAMPLMAQIEPMKESISEIEDRVFNISLYAGLSEQVRMVREGAPAAIGEKLHVMQLRRYMDEEALLDYDAGGMEFKDMHAFDAWMSRPANFERLLPFPRTLLAMRVRRNAKERETDGTMLAAYVKFQLDQTDRFTYLYIRNGDRLYRMDCDMVFDEMIFPSDTTFGGAEPMMFKMFASKVTAMMPRREYEHLKAQHDDLTAKSAAWRAENPGAAYHENPHSRELSRLQTKEGVFDPHAWKPFDPTNVHFDEALDVVQDEIKKYNRIALIVQGLFDRSEVLHPHAPVQSWTHDGFQQAIELVMDGEAVLHSGDKPDFEAYRARLNASLGVGSIVSGADDHWTLRAAEKENDRIDRSGLHRTQSYKKRFRPYGDPGPGKLARIAEWRSKAQLATFRWERERVSGLDMVPASIRIPASDLLNVDAYTPGDYLQFFRDPRTRAEYLQWAPLLLAAEKHHASLRQADADPFAKPR